MNTQRRSKTLIVAFVVLLILVIGISVTGMALLHRKPLVLQGEIEATEIRISGKLPGRIDRFLVQEGESVQQGDTLVWINSPEAEAKYEQVDALKRVAIYQNQKVDDGTRVQIVETLRQLLNKAQSDRQLAYNTYMRVQTLYRDSVVTLQRMEEVQTLYEAAEANVRAAEAQYQMAVDGAQRQDRESAQSMVSAARGVVGEVRALLQDARLVAPASGEIAEIYPARGELVGAGSPIMSLVVLEDAHVVLNLREDLLPRFRMGSTFRGDVPALARKGISFRVNYLSPLGSYATWRSTKQVGSYDLRTFELHALPEPKVDGLRPGMSVLITLEP
ncbi:MAG: biotin/lipoyl-binding protein [Alistipes sp.]|nr:biotin/lipoyl-binding protein [Alistipes sp.]